MQRLGRRDEFRDSARGGSEGRLRDSARSDSRSDFRWGDTLIEVLFAVSIFGIVALLTITTMNHGVTIAEATLEESMARMEIDAQAEAIRFIQNSYANDHELKDPEYKGLWEAIKKVADNNSSAQSLSDVSKCSDKYTTEADGILNGKSFIVNTRNIDINGAGATIVASTAANRSKFQATPLYPRILYSGTTGTSNSEDATMGNDSNSYTTVLRAEGIWIYPVSASPETTNTPPQFYDFHISTCWYSPNGNRPTTIGTILRLYNPEYVER